MIDHLKNLEEYIKDSKKEITNEDIKWAIDELKALYELVDEMKNENIKTRKD